MGSVSESRWRRRVCQCSGSGTSRAADRIRIWDSRKARLLAMMVSAMADPVRAWSRGMAASHACSRHVVTTHAKKLT